jgi:hypothetical protein
MLVGYIPDPAHRLMTHKGTSVLKMFLNIRAWEGLREVNKQDISQTFMYSHTVYR